MAAPAKRKPSAPALGLSDYAITNTCKTRANVDSIDVVIETVAAHQPNTIKSKLPPAWPREGRGAVKVSFAMPGKTDNASQFIRLTFHDPMSGSVSRQAIENFIFRELGAVRRMEFDAIEHGIDLVRPAGKTCAVTQELMNAWGSFAAELARCIQPVKCMSIYRLPSLRTYNGKKKGEISGDRYKGIAHALASGKTVYIGNDPKKDKGMCDCTQFRYYKKKSAHKDSPEWPEARHFFRIEQTSLGRAMPIVDVLDLLDESQHKVDTAKRELAKCWHAHHIRPGFSGLVQRWKLQFEENLDEWAKAEAKTRRLKPYKYAIQLEPSCKAQTIDKSGKVVKLKITPPVWPASQSSWNDRMNKAFLRMAS